MVYDFLRRPGAMTACVIFGEEQLGHASLAILLPGLGGSCSVNADQLERGD